MSVNIYSEENQFLMKFKVQILATFVLLSCGQKEALKKERVQEMQSVATQPVIEKSLSEPILGSGVLASKSEMKLAFKTGGMIRKIYVNEGQFVKEGQLIAELDLSEIDAQVNQTKIGLAKAKRDLERVQRLYADSAATLTNVQDATSGFEAASQTIQVAEFNQRLSKIYAPASGRILRKISEQGELITPFAPAFILATGASAYVVNIGLADKDMVKVKLGDRASVHLDAYPTTLFRATVTQIAQTVNPATGTFEVELQIQNAGNLKLVSGFVAKAEIAHGSKKSLVIPVEALVEADGQNAYVFVLNASGKTVDKYPITVGRIVGQEVEVLDGLDLETQVVVRGANFLSDKAKVKIAK